MSETNINWFPGHMAKTRRQIEQDLKLVDLVIEILDARIPVSSQNPDIGRLIKNKKRLVILNKSDMADKRENDRWINYFKNNNIPALLCNSKSGQGVEKIEETINKLLVSEKEKALLKGRSGKIIRAIIVGIPNVGKSSFINRISKKANTEVGNKPGVTKQKQWIRLSNNIELLDTPGVLWPKFEQESVALNLAYTGTIKSEIIDEVDIAYNLIKYLVYNYPSELAECYKIESSEIDNCMNSNKEENEKIVDVMNLVGKKRGAISKGGVIDLERTSKIILDDFKNGKIGNITLEKVK